MTWAEREASITPELIRKLIIVAALRGCQEAYISETKRRAEERDRIRRTVAPVHEGWLDPDPKRWEIVVRETAVKENTYGAV